MRFLPGFLTRNWKMKLAAFGLAVLLWTSVRVEAPNRSTFDVPVRIQLNDPRWAISESPSPDTVSVQVSGPAREVFRLAVSGTLLRVPIDEVASPDTTILLRNSWVSLAGFQGVVVEGLEPRSLQARFERIAVRDIPVALRIRGLDEDLAFRVPPVAEPRALRVSGPSSRVGALDSLPVTLDASDIEESGVFPAVPDTTDLTGVQFDVDTVRVTLQIEQVAERVVTGVPIRLPARLRTLAVADPAASSLTLRGVRARLEELQRDSLRFEVPAGLLDEWSPDQGPVRVPVVLRGVPPVLSAITETDSVTVRPGQGDG